MTHLAYIGVGSNLCDPAANVRNGVAELTAVGTVRAQSSLYRTKPWGVTDQPDYVNAVVQLETQLSPYELLEALKKLELGLGRTPSKRWGPRHIDFDILTFDNVVLEDAALHIPHPRMTRRAFVLVPLAEIAGEYAPLLAALGEEERATVTLWEPDGTRS